MTDSRFLRGVQYILQMKLNEHQALRFLKRIRATDEQIERFKQEFELKNAKLKAEKKAKKV
jgi:hypothetical protein